MTSVVVDLCRPDTPSFPVSSYGGKASQLADLEGREFPIPRTFLISVETIEEFVPAHAHEQILTLLNLATARSTRENLDQISAQLQQIIHALPVPITISRAINLHLSPALSYAVRSSSVLEDGSVHSFAGQSESYLNLPKREVPDAIRACLASLYTTRILHYCIERQIDLKQLRMGVLVQEMIHSDVSGILFYRGSSESLQTDIVLIEAVRGLGDRLAGGLETPARYLFAGTEQCVDSSDPTNEVLTPAELCHLNLIAKEIYELKGFNLDLEFAIQNETIFIVQCRPLTSVCGSIFERSTTTDEQIQGAGASPGIACGPVFLSTDRPIPGGILFDRMTTPDMLPLIREAAGIVTQQGGLTCHAAIVSRELGKPCVVGIGTEHTFARGELITINGIRGWVRRGDHSELCEKIRTEDRQLDDIRTSVRLQLNLSVPEVATRSRSLPAEGVGLVRLEFLYAHALEMHPLALSGSQREQAIQEIYQGLAEICEAFAPRRVMIRMCDFKTNEYRQMPDGVLYEPREENPMLGWRGCMRLLSKQNRSAFELELEIFRRLSKSFANFDIMIPFIRTAPELAELRLKLQEAGLDLRRHRLIALIETVSAVDDLAEIVKQADGVSIGSNDLYQLYFGLDRDNDRFDQLYLERYGILASKHPGFRQLIARIIATCKAANRSIGICGQVTSFDPEMIDFLVDQQIDYISCPPNAFYYVKRQIVLKEHGQIL